MGKDVTERNISLKTVDGSFIQGKINIGPMQRISDMFRENEAPFIIVYDARSMSGENKVFIVNKSHIVWVEPDDASVTDS